MEKLSSAADGGVVFDRVTKKYGNVTAVDAVSFEVAKGELVTLLGPSGCGKTTT
ncbi:MAG: ATP-binding cassette domain-containing protein, partial [Casimicrobiaceae bacterium]